MDGHRIATFFAHGLHINGVTSVTNKEEIDDESDVEEDHQVSNVRER